jgi:hypothetical protein
VPPPSEPFGAKERVGEIDEEPRGEASGEGVIECHGRALSDLLADEGVENGESEKAEADGEHDEIGHGTLPPFRGATSEIGLPA